MKILLQLTSQDWVALKRALLRLNAELGQQGLAEHHLNALLASVERDEQLVDSPLKLAVIIQALLSQAVTDKGCMLGAVMLNTLIVHDWVSMSQSEYTALQRLKAPLTLTDSQTALDKTLGADRNETLAEIMQQLLWKSSTGQWFIDTLAWAKLQQRAHTSVEAKLNSLLLDSLILQQVKADWVGSAIKKLEHFAHSLRQRLQENKRQEQQSLDYDTLCIRQQQALVAYHLCELYRLRLGQAKKMQRVERCALEDQWRQNFHRLQQLNVWPHLLTQVQNRLTMKKAVMRFYFYGKDREKESALTIKRDSTYNPHAGSLPWIMLSAAATAGLSYFLWKVILTVLAMTLSVTTLLPVSWVGLLTFCALSVFIISLWHGVKEIQCNRKIERRQAKHVARMQAKAKSSDGLLPIDVLLHAQAKPADTLLIHATASPALQATSALPADLVSSASLGLSKALQRVGLYRTGTQSASSASTTTTQQHAATR